VGEVSNQLRQPQGTPAGGQFTGSSHAESDVALDSASDLPTASDLIDYLDQMEADERVSRDDLEVVFAEHAERAASSGPPSPAPVPSLSEAYAAMGEARDNLRAATLGALTKLVTDEYPTATEVWFTDEGESRASSIAVLLADDTVVEDPWPDADEDDDDVGCNAAGEHISELIHLADSDREWGRIELASGQLRKAGGR